MKLLVAVTDGDWYRHLRARPHLTEANFWQPSGSTGFRALEPGEIMLFKLHSPHNWIVGGGHSPYFQRLSYRAAWDFFGEANGAPDRATMRKRIAKYRRVPDDLRADFEIGCIMLHRHLLLRTARLDRDAVGLRAQHRPLQGLRPDGDPYYPLVGRRIWTPPNRRLARFATTLSGIRTPSSDREGTAPLRRE